MPFRWVQIGCKINERVSISEHPLYEICVVHMIHLNRQINIITHLAISGSNLFIYITPANFVKFCNGIC